MLRIVFTLGIAVAVAALLLWLPWGEAPEASGAALIDLTSSDSCRSCHAEVFAEWERSYHGQSFTDPLVLAKEQSNNFRNLQCIPCHAPSPVLEHGIGKGARVVERSTHRHQGVDCLACHRIGNSMAATRSLPTSHAACAPVEVPELSQASLCAPCHNQHETVDEWEASDYYDRGVGCLDCHMPPVQRRRPDGSERSGRSHEFPGAHSQEMLETCFDLSTEIRSAEGGGGELVVSIRNTGAGHNFPSDARHRAVDLVVTLIGADGVELPPRDFDRPFGCENGTERRRFRNPYRQEPRRRFNAEKYGRENTQIPAGATEVLAVAFPPGIGAARIEVVYKLTPLQSDAEGRLLQRLVVDLSEDRRP